MTLRDWPEPGRPDIKMFARAGDSSPGFSNHTGSEIGWWPAEPPQFGGKKFDAIFCCNFIEHIDEPLTFIARAIDTLAPNGRIFLEWPKPESISLPTTGDLASFGVSVTTCAYHDDRTHREAPPPKFIRGHQHTSGTWFSNIGARNFICTIHRPAGRHSRATAIGPHCNDACVLVLYWLVPVCIGGTPVTSLKVSQRTGRGSQGC